jgi:hypothetical protein
VHRSDVMKYWPVLAFLAGQFVGGLIWSARIDSRVAYLEPRVDGAMTQPKNVCALRQEHRVPLLAALEAWLREERSRMSSVLHCERDKLGVSEVCPVNYTIAR